MNYGSFSFTRVVHKKDVELTRGQDTLLQYVTIQIYVTIWHQYSQPICNPNIDPFA